MNKLSVTIITFNEENNIAACLESVKWADEIVVVDSFSKDRTVEIAKKYTEKVYQYPWEGYVQQNNIALGKATLPWVLRLDADERVTPKLAEEIKKVLNSNGDYSGFRVPRKISFMGRFLKRPERHHLRLFKKEKTRWVGGKVHEHAEVEGKIGRLSQSILHYSHQNISKSIEKLNVYSSLHVDGKNRFPLFFHLALGWVFTFCQEYFFYYRFLDGMPGLIYSQQKSFYVSTKYAKRWEKILAS